MRRSLVIDAVFSFSLKLSGTAILFALTVYISRRMGADALGYFSLFMSLLLPLSVLARLGLDSNLLKLVSQPANESDGCALYLQSLSAVCIASILLSTLLLIVDVVMESLAVSFKVMPLLSWLAVALPFHGLLLLNVFYMRGRHWVVQAAIFENVVVYLFVLFGLLFSYELMGQQLSVAAVALGMVAASLASFFYLGLSWERRGKATLEAKSVPALKTRFSEALPMLGTSLATMAFVTLDVFLLSFFVSYAEVGHYAAAAKLVAFTGFPLMAVISMVGARLSEAHANGDQQQLKKIYMQSTALAVWVGLPILIVIALFPVPLLEVFGKDFSEAKSVVYILILGQCVNLFMGPIGYMLWMTGHASKLQKVTLLSLTLLILFSLVLVPFLGMEGAAIAVTIALIAKSAGCWWLVKNWLGFNPLYSFWKGTPYASS